MRYATDRSVDQTTEVLGRRQRRRRRLGGATAGVVLCGFAFAGCTRGDPPPVAVIAPPPTAATTTTEFDPHWEPTPDHRSTTTLADWEDAPEACASPASSALRADLTGDGSREYIAYFDGALVDGIGSQVLRICAGDRVWEHQGSNTSLLTVLRVGDRWFVAWGGTSGGGRHQTLLALVDDELIDVVDQAGDAVRLIEGLPTGDPPDQPFQITRWWGCEDDLLVNAEREDGTQRWTVTRYRWDTSRPHMVVDSTEVRTHDPHADGVSPDGERTYAATVEALSDVLPPACDGADDWGPGGVPRSSARPGDIRWLG